jgi:hypothetical protein
VALLTSLLSIPIEMFLIVILEVYGSTWPGSRGYVDDLGDKKEGKEEGEGKERKEEEEVKRESETKGAKALREEIFRTEFGQLVKMTGVINMNSATKARNNYDDLASPKEEAKMLIDKVNDYIFSGDLEDSWLPWELHKSTDYKTLERIAKINSIETYLGNASGLGVGVKVTVKVRG